MIMRYLASLVMMLSLASPAHAGLEAFDFSGRVNETRYLTLISELRCLVCQNQSLADSDAGLAHDLRKEVYALMDAGNDDAQVVEFLTQRYGDFVLYNPPLKPSTWLLWYGPFMILAAGSVLLWLNLRQRARQSDPGFTQEEQDRLKQLLCDGNTVDRGSTT